MREVDLVLEEKKEEKSGLPEWVWLIKKWYKEATLKEMLEGDQNE